ncbi:HGxxPAAW family protein [Streptomyces sp. NPDC050704]|uniref:HGxxPAAW family protein n=1 Tax=Streptomyces sp. NPDC050704 TaxID=3157219 RepID=UPI00342BAF34
MSEHHHDEGHTVAGWTGFAIAVIGTSVAGLGMTVGPSAGIWLGLAVVGLSALVTWGLHLSGWGKPPGIRPVAERGWRVRDRAARDGHAGCVGCRLAGRGRRPVRASAVVLSSEQSTVSQPVVSKSAVSQPVVAEPVTAESGGSEAGA